MSKQRTPDQQRLDAVCAKIIAKSRLHWQAERLKRDTIVYNMEAGEHERLDAAARRLGLSRSEFLRGAVREAIDRANATSAISDADIEKYI